MNFINVLGYALPPQLDNYSQEDCEECLKRNQELGMNVDCSEECGENYVEVNELVTVPYTISLENISYYLKATEGHLLIKLKDREGLIPFAESYDDFNSKFNKITDVSVW